MILKVKVVTTAALTSGRMMYRRICG